MADDKAPRLAVLIDAENASARIAEALFSEIATLGEASARRIYGDFASPQIAGWTRVLARFAIQPQQNFANTKGKNSGDIALVIDAMDLLHSGRFDGFCLVSSDADFTRLAARIREEGVDVYGFGEQKTPESFRQACTRFIYTENLIAPVPVDAGAKSPVAEAPATVAHPPAHIPAAEVPVELRGAGRSSRQVHNFGTPQALEADRLIVCEVITPAENWSSYPPHKHDESIPGHESSLEEIYYFETAVTRNATAPASAQSFGYMRNYTSVGGEIDTLAEVHSGDIALVPFGWHGPCVAAPGYDLYYLNVMAGPDAERSWLITDDPAHAWIRETWTGQDFDARLPYTAQTTGTK